MLYKHYLTSSQYMPEIFIWRIDETVEEMLDMFPPQIAESYKVELDKFKHSKRKLEFLCARHLLRMAVDEDHTVLYEKSGRPYLSTSSREMNISHTKDYVAIAMHKDKRVALDIETRGVKVERVMHKFLTDKETSMLSSDHEIMLLQLHLLWCAKETLYKIMSHSDTEFNRHLHIESIGDSNSSSYDEKLDTCGVMNCYEDRTDERRKYLLRYRIFPDFVLVYGITD